MNNNNENLKIKWHHKKVKVPSVIQMEAVECGAASLAMVLAYHGKFIPLEEMRVDCGVSRDGSKASNMVKAARKHGLVAKGLRIENPENVREYPLPIIVFWNFNHFVVLTGIKKDRVYINDPATGPRTITREEFDQAFTGVVLTFERGPEFKKGGEKPNVINSLRKRLQGSSAVLTYVVLAGLFLVIPGLVIPIFSKIFVDNILVSQMFGWFKPLLLAMGLTALLRGTLTWFQRYYLLRFETKLALTSSAKFFHHIFRLPINFFFQRGAGELGNRVQLNDKVAQLLSGDLATNMLNVLMIIFYAILMFQYDVVLTLVGVFIAFINFMALKYVSQKRVDLNQRLRQEYGKLIGTTMGGLQMIETLKATGSESDYFSLWSGYQAKLVNAQQELGLTTRLLMAVPPFLTAINNVAILALGGLRVMEGHLSMGMLVAFQSLMSSFITPVNQMVSLGSKLQETTGDIKRLDDVYKHEVDSQFVQKAYEDDSKNHDVHKITKLEGNLELRNVTFGYSLLEPPLIEDFNLSLKPGDRVALVGASGSGKSTVAKLVTGLYEPWKGEILFDGKPRKSYPQKVINNSLAAVDQELFLFEGTIRENLTMWDTSVPDDNVVQAAKDSLIHEDVSARPGGYDSKLNEGGTNFSGGQRQRMEIARALNNNMRILVLDEATSSLDTRTEKIIDDNVRRRGCTTLIVAHRLSTIRDCDEIIVLEKGKVVQRGTHDEMIKSDGPYSRLIKAH